ncbi:MAG: AAA family ATPase, partial [Verrucomicrobia bacterium]|nr:AAA family ATPase [Verrucomicrobiota bacterium]
MIRTLSVERFKSLMKLELELGRINVFIGANGSGKSNLLEAVGVLGAAAFGRVDDETLLRPEHYTHLDDRLDLESYICWCKRQPRVRSCSRRNPTPMLS